MAPVAFLNRLNRVAATEPEGFGQTAQMRFSLSKLHPLSRPGSATARRAGLLCCLVLLLGCCACAGGPKPVRIQTTAYCGCGKCCGWERGSWKFLKLDFWNRYVSHGPNKGRIYSGLTARGTEPHEPNPGLFRRPWYIFFPWLWFPRDGTLAADTRYYPFGTRFYIPGYGYGVVEDRGSAIKGPHRLDLYFDSHERALQWGRKTLEVQRLD